MQFDSRDAALRRQRLKQMKVPLTEKLRSYLRDGNPRIKDIAFELHDYSKDPILVYTIIKRLYPNVDVYWKAKIEDWFSQIRPVRPYQPRVAGVDFPLPMSNREKFEEKLWRNHVERTQRVYEYRKKKAELERKLLVEEYEREHGTFEEQMFRSYGLVPDSEGWFHTDQATQIIPDTQTQILDITPP